MSEIVERLRDSARGFRERARLTRPHPQNPHKIDAGTVSRFVDVYCACIAQEVDEAAGTIEALEAENRDLLVDIEIKRKKLEDAEARVAELEEVVEDLCIQFAYTTSHAGGAAIFTGGLSALENGFGVLCWDDPHPIPWDTCDEPGSDIHRLSSNVRQAL